MTYSAPVYDNIEFQIWPNYSAPESDSVSFLVDQPPGADIISNIPAFQADGHELYKNIAVSLPVFESFVREVNTNDVTVSYNTLIPMFVASGTISDSSQIITSIPSFEAEIFSSAHISITLPVFTADGTILPGISIISSNVKIPTFQALASVFVSQLSDIAVNIPAFYSYLNEIVGNTAGDVNISVPGFESSGTLYIDVSGNIQVTIPNFVSKANLFHYIPPDPADEISEYILEHTNIIAR